MIELHISATSPQELIDTINGLATLGAARMTHSVAAPVQVEDVEEERPQPEAPVRRGRRSKDTTAAAENSGAPSAEAPSGDQFSQQIREANAEAAAERAAETGDPITYDTVHAAFARACSPGGKMTMLEAQNLLKANFQTAGGEPARRVAEIQPKDYAAVLARLEG